MPTARTNDAGVAVRRKRLRELSFMPGGRVGQINVFLARRSDIDPCQSRMRGVSAARLHVSDHGVHSGKTVRDLGPPGARHWSG